MTRRCPVHGWNFSGDIEVAPLRAQGTPAVGHHQPHDAPTMGNSPTCSVDHDCCPDLRWAIPCRSPSITRWASFHSASSGGAGSAVRREVSVFCATTESTRSERRHPICGRVRWPRRHRLGPNRSTSWNRWVGRCRWDVSGLWGSPDEDACIDVVRDGRVSTVRVVG